MEHAAHPHLPVQTQHGEIAGDDTAALTRAAARGDPRAFGVLYERWFDRAYAAARQLTGRDENFCLDVVQETMLRAARRMPSLPSEAALSRWLCVAVHRVALDHLRAERRRRGREVGRGEPHRAAPDEDRIAWLRDRLRELPSEDRFVLGARYFRARTLDQIGTELGTTGDSAHGRLRRLLERLRGGEENRT